MHAGARLFKRGLYTCAYKLPLDYAQIRNLTHAEGEADR